MNRAAGRSFCRVVFPGGSFFCSGPGDAAGNVSAHAFPYGHASAGGSVSENLPAFRGAPAFQILNAFFSLALAALGEIAEELREKEDAVFYRETARKVNDTLRETFFDPETGLFRSFSDRRQGEFSVLTNSLCLLSGAADGLPQGPILALLADGTVKEGFRAIPCTLSMNCFRFDSLLKADRKTYAPRILDELDRTYLAMLEKGATSFWETVRGEADFGGAGSLCHGWSALPLYYYALLCGEEKT